MSKPNEVIFDFEGISLLIFNFDSKESISVTSVDNSGRSGSEMNRNQVVLLRDYLTAWLGDDLCDHGPEIGCKKCDPTGGVIKL